MALCKPVIITDQPPPAELPDNSVYWQCPVCKESYWRKKPMVMQCRDRSKPLPPPSDSIVQKQKAINREMRGVISEEEKKARERELFFLVYQYLALDLPHVLENEVIERIKVCRQCEKYRWSYCTKLAVGCGCQGANQFMIYLARAVTAIEFKGSKQKPAFCPNWGCSVISTENLIESCNSLLSEEDKLKIQNGPGTILYALILKYLDEEEGFDCGCIEWVSRMNFWGPEGCRKNFDKIIERLQETAKIMKWDLKKWWARWSMVLSSIPIFDVIQKTAIEFMVNYAIDESERRLPFWQLG